MTIKDKLNLYGFKGERKRNAWFTLKTAQMLGLDIDKLQLVCEPNDKISYVERK